MKVLKFGGSCLGNKNNYEDDASRIKQVANVIAREANENGDTVVVVSALGGVTDDLIEAAQLAARNEEFTSASKEHIHPPYLEKFLAITNRHNQLIEALLPSEKAQEVMNEMKYFYSKLRKYLDGAALSEEFTDQAEAKISTLGEHMSAKILEHVINDQKKTKTAQYLDSSIVIEADSNAEPKQEQWLGAKVNFQKTQEKMDAHFKEKIGLVIATGFNATGSDNKVRTLGRNGSDTTASIYAGALNADEIVLYKNTDGVYTANPAIVPHAQNVPHLTPREAIEGSHHGDYIIHPDTMRNVLEKEIPIIIKNAFNPEFKGTRIDNNPPETPWNSPIKTISVIEEIVKIRVQGAALIGKKGMSGRISDCIAIAGGNIITQTQLGSEYKITYGVRPEETQPIFSKLQEEFAYELGDNSMSISTDTEALLSIVGEGMVNQPGVLSKITTALSEKEINIDSCVQEGDQAHINIGVALHDKDEAVRSIHDAFIS